MSAWFAEVWSDGYLADDVATSLTCVEVDALASLLSSEGRADGAARWLIAHAEGDDSGDLHSEVVDETKAVEYLGGLG